MKASALLLAALLVGCKTEYVVVKPPRPNPMPAPPVDRAQNLPSDADLAAMIEAVMKDLADYKLYSAQLLGVVEATTEPPKTKPK